MAEPTECRRLFSTWIDDTKQRRHRIIEFVNEAFPNLAIGHDKRDRHSDRDQSEQSQEDP